jgi:hypothetical protein
MTDIPNTNQPGQVLQSVGDGLNTTKWGTSSGGYASLTGTGETATPGDLAQSGGLAVTIPSGDSTGFQVTDNGSGGVSITTIASNGLSLSALSGAWLYLSANSSGEVHLFKGTGTTGQILISNAGSGNIVITCPGGGNVYVAQSGSLSFFGVSPVGRQASGGTLAGVIAGLVALGLFSS